MKILFFCNLVPNKLGAYEAWLVSFAQLLADRGDSLVLAVPGSLHPSLESDFERLSVPVLSMDPWTDAQGREHAWAFIKPALRHLRAVRPDIAVLNYGNELPAFVTCLLARCLGFGRIRWIWQQHQQVCDPNGVTAKLSTLRLLSLVYDRFIAVYDGGRESLVRRGIPSHRVDVVYNGIRDYARQKASGWLRTELGVPPGTIIMACTGWLVPRKRVGFILRGFAAALPEIRQSALLLVIGEGPEAAALQQDVAALGLDAHVRFMGLRNDVREILYEIDILLHAARAETCTYVISEAMSASRPCVVTEAGAAREQIVSGESGYVVAPEDNPGFVRAVVELSNDPDVRDAFGHAARRRWESRYRVEDAAETYHAICRAALGE